MATIDIVDACHSHHATAPCPDAERIDWGTPTRRTQHVRVRDHTCDCRRPTYELCTAAGLWFVRRSSANGTVVTSESPWLSARAAEHLWGQILYGQAW